MPDTVGGYLEIEQLVLERDAAVAQAARLQAENARLQEQLKQSQADSDSLTLDLRLVRSRLERKEQDAAAALHRVEALNAQLEAVVDAAADARHDEAIGLEVQRLHAELHDYRQKVEQHNAELLERVETEQRLLQQLARLQDEVSLLRHQVESPRLVTQPPSQAAMRRASSSGGLPPDAIQQQRSSQQPRTMASFEGGLPGLAPSTAHSSHAFGITAAADELAQARSGSAATGQDEQPAQPVSAQQAGRDAGPATEPVPPEPEEIFIDLTKRPPPLPGMMGLPLDKLVPMLDGSTYSVPGSGVPLRDLATSSPDTASDAGDNPATSTQPDASDETSGQPGASAEQQHSSPRSGGGSPQKPGSLPRARGFGAAAGFTFIPGLGFVPVVFQDMMGEEEEDEEDGGLGEADDAYPSMWGEQQQPEDDQATTAHDSGPAQTYMEDVAGAREQCGEDDDSGVPPWGAEAAAGSGRARGASSGSLEEDGRDGDAGGGGLMQQLHPGAAFGDVPEADYGEDDASDLDVGSSAWGHLQQHSTSADSASGHQGGGRRGAMPAADVSTEQLQDIIQQAEADFETHMELLRSSSDENGEDLLTMNTDYINSPAASLLPGSYDNSRYVPFQPAAEPLDRAAAEGWPSSGAERGDLPDDAVMGNADVGGGASEAPCHTYSEDSDDEAGGSKEDAAAAVRSLPRGAPQQPDSEGEDNEEAMEVMEEEGAGAGDAAAACAEEEVMPHVRLKVFTSSSSQLARYQQQVASPGAGDMPDLDATLPGGAFGVGAPSSMGVVDLGATLHRGGLKAALAADDAVVAAAEAAAGLGHTLPRAGFGAGSAGAPAQAALGGGADGHGDQADGGQQPAAKRLAEEGSGRGMDLNASLRMKGQSLAAIREAAVWEESQRQAAQMAKTLGGGADKPPQQQKAGGSGPASNLRGRRSSGGGERSSGSAGHRATVSPFGDAANAVQELGDDEADMLLEDLLRDRTIIRPRYPTDRKPPGETDKPAADRHAEGARGRPGHRRSLEPVDMAELMKEVAPDGESRAEAAPISPTGGFPARSLQAMRRSFDGQGADPPLHSSNSPRMRWSSDGTAHTHKRNHHSANHGHHRLAQAHGADTSDGAGEQHPDHNIGNIRNPFSVQDDLEVEDGGEERDEEGLDDDDEGEEMQSSSAHSVASDRMHDELEAMREELGQKSTLVAGLRGELRKYTELANRLEHQLHELRAAGVPGAVVVHQLPPIRTRATSDNGSVPAATASSAPAPPGAPGAAAVPAAPASPAPAASPAPPHQPSGPKPQPIGGLDAPARLSLYRQILSTATKAGGAANEDLQAAQELLANKTDLDPGSEKVMLIKLQKLVSAGMEAAWQLTVRDKQEKHEHVAAKRMWALERDSLQRSAEAAGKLSGHFRRLYRQQVDAHGQLAASCSAPPPAVDETLPPDVAAALAAAGMELPPYVAVGDAGAEPGAPPKKASANPARPKFRPEEGEESHDTETYHVVSDINGPAGERASGGEGAAAPSSDELDALREDLLTAQAELLSAQHACDGARRQAHELQQTVHSLQAEIRRLKANHAKARKAGGEAPAGEPFGEGPTAVENKGWAMERTMLLHTIDKLERDLQAAASNGPSTLDSEAAASKEPAAPAAAWHSEAASRPGSAQQAQGVDSGRSVSIAETAAELITELQKQVATLEAQVQLLQAAKESQGTLLEALQSEVAVLRSGEGDVGALLAELYGHMQLVVAEKEALQTRLVLISHRTSRAGGGGNLDTPSAAQRLRNVSRGRPADSEDEAAADRIVELAPATGHSRPDAADTAAQGRLLMELEHKNQELLRQLDVMQAALEDAEGSAEGARGQRDAAEEHSLMLRQQLLEAQEQMARVREQAEQALAHASERLRQAAELQQQANRQQQDSPSWQCKDDGDLAHEQQEESSPSRQGKEAQMSSGGMPVTALHQRVIELGAEVAGKDQALQLLTAQMKGLQAELQSTQADLEAAQHDATTWQQQCQSLQAQLDGVHADVAEVLDNNHVLDAELQATIGRLRQLAGDDAGEVQPASIATLNACIALLASQQQQLQQDAADQAAQLAALQLQLQRTAQEAEQFANEAQAAHTEAEAARQEAHAAAERAAGSSSLEEMLAEEQQARAEAERQLAAAQREARDQRQQLAALGQEAQSARQDADQQAAARSAAERALEAAQQGLVRARAELWKAQAAVQEACREREASQAQLATLQQQLASLEHLAQSRTEQVAELEQSLDSADALMRDTRKQLEEAIANRQLQRGQPANPRCIDDSDDDDPATSAAAADAARIRKLELEVRTLRDQLRDAAQIQDEAWQHAQQLQRDIVAVEAHKTSLENQLEGLQDQLRSLQFAAERASRDGMSTHSALHGNGGEGRTVVPPHSAADFDAVGQDLLLLRRKKEQLQKDVAALGVELQQQAHDSAVSGLRASSSTAAGLALSPRTSAWVASPIRGAGSISAGSTAGSSAMQQHELAQLQLQVQQLQALLALQHDITLAKDRSLAAVQQTVALLEAALSAQRPGDGGASTVSSLRASMPTGDAAGIRLRDYTSSVSALHSQVASNEAVIRKLEAQVAAMEARWQASQRNLAQPSGPQGGAPPGSRDGLAPAALQQRLEQKEQEVSSLSAELEATRAELTVVGSRLHEALAAAAASTTAYTKGVSSSSAPQSASSLSPHDTSQVLQWRQVAEELNSKYQAKKDAARQLRDSLQALAQTRDEDARQQQARVEAVRQRLLRISTELAIALRKCGTFDLDGLSYGPLASSPSAIEQQDIGALAAHLARQSAAVIEALEALVARATAASEDHANALAQLSGRQEALDQARAQVASQHVELLQWQAKCMALETRLRRVQGTAGSTTPAAHVLPGSSVKAAPAAGSPDGIHYTQALARDVSLLSAQQHDLRAQLRQLQDSASLTARMDAMSAVSPSATLSALSPASKLGAGSTTSPMSRLTLTTGIQPLSYYASPAATTGLPPPTLQQRLQAWSSTTPPPSRPASATPTASLVNHGPATRQLQGSPSHQSPVLSGQLRQLQGSALLGDYTSPRMYSSLGRL